MIVIIFARLINKSISSLSPSHTVHRSLDNINFQSAGHIFSNSSGKNHSSNFIRLANLSNDVPHQKRPVNVSVIDAIMAKHKESVMTPEIQPEEKNADRLVPMLDDGVTDLAEDHLILVKPLRQKQRREREKMRREAEKRRRQTWEQIQKDRRALVQEACIRHPGLHEDLFHVIEHEPSKLSNFLVSDRFKIIFSVVPTVASDFWKDAFQELVKKNESEAEGSSASQFADGEVRNLSSYRAWEIRLRLRHYKKVIFVRDPFSRLLSTYRRKFLPSLTQENRLYGPIIAETYREGYTAKDDLENLNITFKEFAYFVNDISNVSNGLWSPISKLTFPCQINYDIIGKLEEGPREFDETLKRTKTQWLVRYRPSDFKEGSHEGSIYDHYFLKLWPSQIRNLYNIYEADFDMFGYSIPNYMRPWVFDKF